MGTNRFYTNCREQGIKLSYQQADELRGEWLHAFREMDRHMVAARMPMSNTRRVARAFGFTSDDGQEETSGGAPQDFMATNAMGMKRVNCSRNSALNFQFQSLAALGAKLAMWNVAMAGFLPRIYNFVHDEIVYGLYPDELKTCIPVIEDCMIRGMRTVCPDVKVGVETCCMMHWDKGAAEFSSLKWDGERPVIGEPSYVQQLKEKEEVK